MGRTFYGASMLILCSALGVAIAGDGLGDPIERDIEPGAIQVALEPVAGGMTAPNWGIFAPGHPDRLFVVDQDGILWAVDLATRTKTVFLDVSALLVELGIAGPGSFDERGFLGVAFHPGYATNGLLYTYTSEPARAPADFSTMPPDTLADHQSVVSEWRVADPGNPGSRPGPSRRVLMTVDQPQFNHNAGAMNFGPDGMLYIALGDGGNADDQGVGHSPQGNGQDPANILGDIIRIDPAGTNSANGRYGIPADNPFLARAGFAPEIFAYGFRNPFRFSFDRLTGALYAADVGQNNIEEVDIVSAGGNYGWRLKEGTFLFDPAGAELKGVRSDGFVFANAPGRPAGVTDPIAQYDHDEGIAVVGGFVYRGVGVPALAGRYLFGENSRRLKNEHGRVFYLDARNRVFEALDGPIGFSVLGTGEDAQGELYVMVNETGVPFENTGMVLKVVSRCPAGEVGEICD